MAKSNLRTTFALSDKASDAFCQAERTIRQFADAAAQWERSLVDASIVMDRDVAEAYARRVGTETAGTAIDALGTARALAIYGLSDHVAATVRCPKCPLMYVVHKPRAVGPTWADPGWPGRFYSVGSDVVRALEASSRQVELRTPPCDWRAAPPMQLFDG